METSPAQADPTPAPPVPDLAAAPVPTEAAPDAGSSTTQLNQPAPTETAPAVDVAGMDEAAYIAARDALIALPLDQLPGQPAATPATPTETPAVPATPANETPEPPADPAAPPALDDDAAPERIRLGGLPDDDARLTAAAVLAAKAKGITVLEAMSRLNGIAASPAAPAPVAHPVAPMDGPEIVEARIAQLEADFDAAADAADTVAMAKATREMRAADRELAQSIAARESAVQASMGKALQLYPDFSNRDGALAQKWDEIYSRLQANNDPLGSGHNPNTPLIVAQMAAAELGIAPRNPSAPATKPAAVVPKAAPSVPSTPPPNAIRPVQPAPGSSRTAVPSNQTGQLEAALAGIKSLDDYEALMNQLQLAR